jgi:hypothetical protein
MSPVSRGLENAYLRFSVHGERRVPLARALACNDCVR